VIAMAISACVEAAGIEFKNGGQPGVRLTPTTAKQINRSD
jgi:hypothetical protein